MTASDIIKIASTVAVLQAAIDLFFNWYIFSQPPYQRLLEKLDRLNYKRLAAVKLQSDVSEKVAGSIVQSNSTKVSSAGKKKVDKSVLKKQVAESDYKDAAAEIARKHILPSIVGSLLFLIVLKILGAEYSGQIVALLPFAPVTFFRRLTSRGLDFGVSHVRDISDVLLVATTAAIEGTGTENVIKESLVKNAAHACSFLFIYMLSSVSIKFYVNKFLAITPPNKDSQGIISLVESPTGQRFLRQLGIDPTEYLQAVHG